MRLHITNGDHAAERLAESGLAGEVLAWSDILFAGPKRGAGFPDIDYTPGAADTLAARATFIAETFALDAAVILIKLRWQYARLRRVFSYEEVVLWFDACLMDQTTLIHLLTCLYNINYSQVLLVCIDEFPGIAEFHGLGQLRPVDFAALFPSRRRVSPAQFALARRADLAFATQNAQEIRRLAGKAQAALPFLAAACARWLEELPDENGLGKLDRLIIQAMQNGAADFAALYQFVAARDSRPQFWGDTWLAAKYRKLVAAR